MSAVCMSSNGILLNYFQKVFSTIFNDMEKNVYNLMLRKSKTTYNLSV